MTDRWTTYHGTVAERLAALRQLQRPVVREPWWLMLWRAVWTWRLTA